MPDNILSKLFFENTNGWNNVFPNGGVPLYNSDIRALENTSKMYGAWTCLKDYDCIISGCLVDEVNTTTKQVKITEGYFIIGGIVYHTEGFTTTYPFSLIPGSETSDDRIFKNGDTFSVATTFNYSIKTTGFSDYDVPGSNQPTKPIKPVLSNEIFFDPFTNQRLEYIQSNSTKSVGEIVLNWSVQSRVGRIFTTQTGKSIVGSEILYEFKEDGVLVSAGRWKYYGWTKYVGSEVIKLNNSLAGSLVGNLNDVITIQKKNIPAHKHNGGTLIANTAGAHKHNITYSGDNSLDNPGQFPNSRNNPDIFMPWADMGMQAAGDHTHTISGNTGDGTADGLKVNPDPINILPASINMTAYIYGGYNTYDTSYYIRNGFHKDHYNF